MGILDKGKTQVEEDRGSSQVAAGQELPHSGLDHPVEVGTGMGEDNILEEGNMEEGSRGEGREAEQQMSPRVLLLSEVAGIPDNRRTQEVDKGDRHPREGQRRRI